MIWGSSGATPASHLQKAEFSVSHWLETMPDMVERVGGGREEAEGGEEEGFGLSLSWLPPPSAFPLPHFKENLSP